MNDVNNDNSFASTTTLQDTGHDHVTSELMAVHFKLYLIRPAQETFLCLRKKEFYCFPFTLVKTISPSLIRFSENFP